VPVGSTEDVPATDDAEAFSFDAEGARAIEDDTQVDITGFDPADDSLIFDLPTASGPTTLDALDGVQGVVVQDNPFVPSTLVTFGTDDNGDLISLELIGVTDPSAVNVDVI